MIYLSEDQRTIFTTHNMYLLPTTIHKTNERIFAQPIIRHKILHNNLISRILYKLAHIAGTEERPSVHER